ncbi:hypothetical protein [Salinisphaera hydrothermalis]|uniref:hypothetical protein n=1 Tax=Salinisphaera hydrothermalis TaxID=563188 RepID=UPI0012EC9F5B|nr:hypothetical protein [Salinisphaera hydrothermalis]
MIFRSSHRRTSTTTRAIDQFIRPNKPIRCNYAVWDGAFLRPAIAGASRTPGGVKYRRLIRMKRRIGGSIPDRW